ncbi:MAG TPA: polyketide synthase, partial [Thermoanaerobaculia bacterium]|nr:polyketide synthase [Thermoanaerobaculia bacterium]
ALAESGIDARHVSYVEAHGTGTKLGDPIEIAALNRAFQRHTQDTGFCLIGSAKSNIGHCESAAGIAGLTKVLLQMQHREIVPSLHSAQLNPHIDFDSSPFIVNQDLRTWEQPVIGGRNVPRIAGISSFGAGGSNAHMIIEEYPAPVVRASSVSVAIVLSARTAEQLRQKAGDLLAFLKSRLPDVDLESMAYTLQTGREAMDERLGFVVDTPAGLLEKLDAWLSGRQGIENTWQGQVRHGGDASSTFTSDADLQQAAAKWITGRKLSRLVEQWVRGLDLDWSRLYGQTKPRRMSLPVYPFARERYWVELPAAVVSASAATNDFLHPLLHRNTSDLTQQSYEAILPAASLGPEIYFEMARAAVVHAARVAPDSTVELREVVWVTPPNEGGEVKAGIALLPSEANRVDFEIYNGDVVLCQGGAIVHREPMAPLGGGRIEGDPRRLALPEGERFPSPYVLHPAIVKAAIETEGAPAFERIPFAVDTVRVLSPCTWEMVSKIRRRPDGDGVTGVDLDLMDESGRICAQLRGLRLREASQGGARTARVEPATAVAPLTESEKTSAPAQERVRREIALEAPSSSSGSPATPKKLAAISLTAPAALTLPAPASSSPKRPVVLTTTAGTTASPVKLHDCGNGIFAVDIAASRAANVIAGVMQALDRVQQESSVKVLMLSGIEHCFPYGGRAEYNEAREQGLFAALAEFPAPVIGLLRGDVIGAGFLAASLCDVLVCCENAQYAFRDAERGVHPTDVEVRLFRERFGETLADELLYGSLAPSTGRQLQAKGWTCPMVPWEEVDAHAEALAAVLAAKSESALRLLKQHLARGVRALVKELAPVDVTFAGGEMRSAAGAGSRQTAKWLDVDALEADPEAAQEGSEGVSAPTVIPLSSTVVTATVHPKGIVVVTMADRTAKNMFSESLVSGLKEAFAHIARTPAYKVVILTGVDGYFASGGTKETLLAIQEGKTRFTDDAIYEAALDCELPVIAAMQGHGIGAGWCLGMFADLVVLSEESRYVSPYMDYGFTPGAGATWILPEALGRDVAVETLFTAQSFTGRELKARGVSLPIVPQAQVLAEAMALAERIAGASRSQLVALKHQRATRIRAALSETYPLELAMHEKTFVGRSETLARIETNFLVEKAKPPIVAPDRERAGVVENVDLAEITATLKKLLAGELQMREGDIGDHAQFVDLGLDSVGGVSWIRKINQRYQTAIEAVKIYAYPTLDQLSRHVREEAEKSGAIVRHSPQSGSGASIEGGTVAQAAKESGPATETLQSWRGRAATRFAGVSAGPRRAAEPIAVIGMAGQFPQATNLDDFWRNIAEGKNCIVQIPRERWDVQAYYQPGEAVPGKTNSRWLGALEEYDRFDPLFFNISPSEAGLMDPQQRLFLQACWHSIEDAGYAARALSGSRCGVFVGCSAGDYHQMSREHQLSAQGFTGSATSILAARISYLLNLQGPCLSIDTACSSSLVAIAEACESLLAGDSDVALAGGVCVLSGPDMHIKTAQA